MPTKTTSTKRPKATTPEANGAVAPASDVLTLAEAAAFLRVPADGLRGDAVAGRLPARLVAGEWRFSKPALIAWLGQPEPPHTRPKTGAELVEYFRQLRESSPYPETEEEAEEFIRQIYAQRKANLVGG